MNSLIDEFDTALVSRFHDGVLRTAGVARWIVVGSTAGRTIEIDISGDVARVRADRIVHALAAEDSFDVQHLVDVVSAIAAGGAEALFGRGIDGEFGFIGHRISGDGFAVTTVDDRAEVLLAVPL
jgi:hypothetical protein